MKRIMMIVMALIMAVMMLNACAEQTPADTSADAADAADATDAADTNAAPAAPESDDGRALLYVYEDGVPVNEAGFKYCDVKEAFSDKEVDGTYYYAASVQDITGKDHAAMQGAFLLAADGYINYVDDLSTLYLAAYKAEDGAYQSVALDGQGVYGGVSSAKYNKGVTAVYLVSTPAEFAVEIQKNGEKIGVLTMTDFMMKTEVGDERVMTALFDGSFLYNYGEDTYEGKFLGISYDTMLAKLSGMGMDFGGNITEVEYYGINGLGEEGKNEEYSTKEDDSKYFGSVDFFCMYDGKTFNTDTRETEVGLTAIINGTGGRWMTFKLSAINFIID